MPHLTLLLCVPHLTPLLPGLASPASSPPALTTDTPPSSTDPPPCPSSTALCPSHHSLCPTSTLCWCCLPLQVRLDLTVTWRELYAVLLGLTQARAGGIMTARAGGGSCGAGVWSGVVRVGDWCVLWCGVMWCDTRGVVRCGVAPLPLAGCRGPGPYGALAFTGLQHVLDCTGGREYRGGRGGIYQCVGVCGWVGWGVQGGHLPMCGCGCRCLCGWVSGGWWVVGVGVGVGVRGVCGGGGTERTAVLCPDLWTV